MEGQDHLKSRLNLYIEKNKEVAVALQDLEV
jgi:hypothetical protein